MLLVKGKLTYRNLNTTYTHIDQFVAGLEKERFTGYCTIGFWEYDAVLFFLAGKIATGLEEHGVRAETVRTGEAAVASILARGHEKDGEINAYTLPTERAALLIASVDGTPKYENLSTDLTSLDRLMAMCKKDGLSGYLDITLEQGAGIVNLFFTNGRLVEAAFASPDNRMVGEPIALDEVIRLCHEHGALFTVYQASAASLGQNAGSLDGQVPDEAIRLFEALLAQVETVVAAVIKPGEFQGLLKHFLTQLDNTYGFLDPFVGDFRYADKTLSYSGDAEYHVFVDGLCDLLNTIVTAVIEQADASVVLPRLSAALEPVNTRYADLIEELGLEARLPELFQDYAFIHEPPQDQAESQASRSILNLQGGAVPDIGAESILRELYRVLSLIAQKYLVGDRTTFPYARFKKSSDYQQLHTAAALLQNFDVGLITRPEASLAFWLNLYNFLVIHGILEHDITTSVRDYKGFFSKTSYRLGDYAFSLDEIEHGILRNNQRRPYTLFRPFAGSDPRRQFCIDPPEPAIHCCLVCGAASSPGLRLYTPRNVPAQMAQTANRFLQSDQGMRVNIETKEVWLNRVFYWYRKDFEQQGANLLDQVIQYLEASELKQFLVRHRAEVKLHFMDYDWSLNAS